MFLVYSTFLVNALRFHLKILTVLWNACVLFLKNWNEVRNSSGIPTRNNNLATRFYGVKSHMCGQRIKTNNTGLSTKAAFVAKIPNMCASLSRKWIQKYV